MRAASPWRSAASASRARPRRACLDEHGLDEHAVAGRGDVAQLARLDHRAPRAHASRGLVLTRESASREAARRRGRRGGPRRIQGSRGAGVGDEKPHSQKLSRVLNRPPRSARSRQRARASPRSALPRQSHGAPRLRRRSRHPLQPNSIRISAILATSPSLVRGREWPRRSSSALPTLAPQNLLLQGSLL